MTHEQLLLSEIEAFLAETGMGPSYFGEKAVGNSKLVSRLRAGSTITFNTARRARAFMEERRVASAKKGAAA